MEINSQETIDYILKNFKKLVSKYSNNVNTPQLVEDSLSILVMYLHKKPRHIPNMRIWLATSLRRKIVHAHKSNKKYAFILDHENFEEPADPFDVQEELEQTSEFKFRNEKVQEYINFLTYSQKESIDSYIKNGGIHLTDSNKVLFYQSIKKIKYLVFGIGKYDKNKYISRGNPRGRKKGFKPVTTNKLGRPSRKDKQ